MLFNDCANRIFYTIRELLVKIIAQYEIRQHFWGGNYPSPWKYFHCAKAVLRCQVSLFGVVRRVARRQPEGWQPTRKKDLFITQTRATNYGISHQSGRLFPGTANGKAFISVFAHER